MYILAIETTCDETGASVVASGQQILSNVITSQIADHLPFKGVVPELASRRHLEAIVAVVEKALSDASLSATQLDAIAVASGPGLVGALIVGIQVAKGMAMALDIPLIPVNHIEAHLYAGLMGHTEPIPLPALGVVLSGGHTHLLKITDVGCYQSISGTVDDAIGEAFDKVAAMLQLPYPGGPEIERLAKHGDPFRFDFHSGQVKGKPLHFSFSGLKTNVLYTVKGYPGSPKDSERARPLPVSEYADVAASFQRAIFDDVIGKAKAASLQLGCRAVLLGGGVTNSRTLRERFANEVDLPLYWPPPGLSLDNAAMIAGLAYAKYQSVPNDWNLTPTPRLDLF